MRNDHISINSENRFKKANKTTGIGALLNILLSLAKLAAGILGHSQAMIADGIHSLSDLGSDLVVIVGMAISSRPTDSSHNYGHGKFETLSALIISIILASIGIGIGISSLNNAVFILQGNPTPKPEFLALIAALVSIVIKEGLFRFTFKVGKKINSPSVIANAYHHRSDAYSSFGSAIGIGGAIMLGNKWVILDPVAGFVISFLIIIEAVKIGRSSLSELLETALPGITQTTILQVANSVPGVYNPHKLRTRRVGNTSVIDLHICINPQLTVEEGHSLAHDVEDGIRRELRDDSIISIHIEPYRIDSIHQKRT